METKRNIGRALFWGGILAAVASPTIAGEIPAQGFGFPDVLTAHMPVTDTLFAGSAVMSSIGINFMMNDKIKGDTSLQVGGYIGTAGFFLLANMLHVSNLHFADSMGNIAPLFLESSNAARALNAAKRA